MIEFWLPNNKQICGGVAIPSRGNDAHQNTQHWRRPNCSPTIGKPRAILYAVALKTRTLSQQAGWMAQISHGITPGRLKQFAEADTRLRTGSLFRPHPVGEGQSVVEPDRRPSFEAGS
jgi:hypothetical protein